MLSSLTTNLQKYYRFDSADVGGNLLAYPPSGFSLTTFTTNIAGGYGTAGQYSQSVTGGAYGNGTYVVYSSSEREAAGRVVRSFGTGTQTTNFWQITATDTTSNGTSITLPNNSILSGLFAANSSGAFTTLANKQIIPGEWVTLQLPAAAVMKQFSFYNTNTNNVAQFAIVASNDNTKWTQLDYQTVPNTFYKTHIFSINNTTAYSYYRFVYIYSYGSYPYLYNLKYFMDNGANNGTSVLNWAGGSGVFDASLSAAPAAVMDICNNVLGQSCLKLNGGQYVTVRNVTPTASGLSTAFWVREPSPVVYKWITSSARTSGNWYGAKMSYDGRVIAAVQPSSATGVNTGQIWRSLDYGVTWTATTAGLNKWYYVAISANGAVMLAVAEGDISVSKTAIISRDFGATWSNTTFTSTSSPYCAISADGRIMYIANKFTNANLVVSKDGGITWTATSSGRCSRVECSANGKTVIIVRLNTEQSVTLTISKDYGTTWSDVTTWATGGYASISISADGYTILAAGYAGSTVISYDGGNTITTLTTPPVTNGSTTSNNFAKISPNGKVMAVGQYLSAVYLSVNAGITWSNIGVTANYYAEAALSYDGSIIVIPNVAQVGIYIGTMLDKTHAIYDFANSDLSLNVTNRGYIGNTEIVLPDNSWHHVVETYTYVSSTGAVNPYNMYIDGNCVHSSMVTYPALTTRATGYIGRSNISPTITDLSGSIDDFRIYDKTLTADQIHNLYLQSAYFYYTFDSVSTNGIMLANMGTGFPQYDAYMSHTGMVQGNEFVVGKGSVQLNANSSQFVTLPSFITGSVGYTIAAWVNVSSADYWARICDFGNGIDVDNIVLASSFVVSENSAFVDFMGVTSHGHITTLLPRNSWTHIAVVRNNSKNVIIYINGNKVSTSTYTGRYNDVLRTLNFIGKSNWPVDSFYHGFIDDFRFYKIPLSDDSVMEIYKNPNLLSTSGFQKHNTELLKLYKSPYSVQPGKVVRVAGSPNTLTEQVAQCFSAVNPTAYNMRMPFATGMCLDNLNNMYIADETNNVIRKISMSNGTLTTYGTGKSAYCGENINVTSNAFTVKRVYQLICDNCNNLIICSDNRIRKINWTSNLITTIAGNGTVGSTGDNGLATSATVGSAIGLWCDSRNNIYISDSYKVRKIDGETGVITTVVGTGTYSYSGDGGLATAATVKLVFSIVTDSKNNLYIADLDSHCIRRVDAISGIITTVAGTGTPGYSGDGGLATAATLNAPHCIRVDNQNNIYILDYNNCIRFISKTNKISTIYGSVNAPFSGDGGLAKYTITSTNPPTMHLDANNNIYIMERTAGVVRKINNMQNRGNTNIDFYDTNNQTLNSYIMPTLAGRAGGTLSQSGYVSAAQRAGLVSTSGLNNLIINGDFNYPANATNTAIHYTNSTAITGWTTIGDVTICNGSSPGALAGGVLSAYSGSQSAFIQTTSGIQQTVTLAVGTYTLSWYMSARTYGSNGNTMLINAVTGSTTVATLTVAGSSISTTVWNQYRLTIPVATAGSYVIKFAGQNTSDTSTLVDYVVLTQTSMLINSDFEYPANATNTAIYYTNSTAITGWTTIGGVTICNGSSPGVLAGGVLSAYSGSQSAFIQTTSGIQQTVTLAVGTYTLSWYMSARTYGSNGNTMLINAVTGSTTVATLTVAGSSISTTVWNQYRLTIPVATAGSYVIKFAGQNTSDTSTLVDYVVLTQTSMLINSDFEYPAITANSVIAYPTGSTAITGWTVNSPTGWLRLLNGDSPGVLSGSVLGPYSGNQSLGINRLSNIYQTVTLGLGMYTLSWYMSGRSYGDGANTILVTVVTGGTTISSTVIQGSAISLSIWQNYTLPVNIITAGSYVIKFEGKRTDDVSTLIDGITLTQHTNTTDMSLYLEPTIQIATPVPTSRFVANTMTTPGGKTFVASASTECNGQEAYNAFNGTTLSYWQCSYNTINGYTQSPYSNGIYRGGGSAAKTHSTTFTANTGFYSSKLQYWTYTGLIGTFGTGTAASEFDKFNNATSAVNVASNGFVTTINSNWTDFGLTSASTHFGIVIRGYFYATSTGNWSFRIGDSGGVSDDYTGLWLGDAAYSPNASNASVIAPNYTLNAPSGIFALTAGTYYPIYMQFSQSFGGLGFGLGITPPGGSQTYDGTPYFFHSVNDSPTCSASMTSLSGEWLQIQLPYKLKLDNYSFLTSDSYQTKSPSPVDPSRWAVVGSNNGTSWNLVDYVDIQNLVGRNILNTTFSNKFYSNILRSFKSSSTEYYSYYRIIVNALDIGSGIDATAHLCQWNLNGIYEYTDSLLPINTKYNSEQLIVPVPGQYWTSNQLFYDNETYTASASTNSHDATPQCAFYNPPANNNISDAIGYGFWHSIGNVYSNTNGTYTGAVSTSYYVNKDTNTQAAILGEWLQLQVTFPVRLSRYGILARAGQTSVWRNRMPRRFVMLGSNDGSTWYLIDAQNHNFSPPADYSYMSYSDKVLHYTFNPTTFSRTATVINTTITRNGNRYVANEAASASSPYPVYDAECSGVLSTSNFKFGNGALSLTAASSQYVQINAPVLTGFDGLTFSVWVQSNSTPEYSRVFDFGNGSNSHNIVFHVSTTNGFTYSYSVVVIGSTAASTSSTGGSFTSPSNTEFNHIVWTISPNGTFTVYVNGKFNVTSTGNYYPESMYRTNHYIGKSNWGTDPYFNGFIDEFRMYNRVVTTGEIQDLYNNKELNNQFPYPYSNGYYRYFRLVTSELYPDANNSYASSDSVNMSMSLTGYTLK